MYIDENVNEKNMCLKPCHIYWVKLKITFESRYICTIQVSSSRAIQNTVVVFKRSIICTKQNYFMYICLCLQLILIKLSVSILCLFKLCQNQLNFPFKGKSPEKCPQSLFMRRLGHRYKGCEFYGAICRSKLLNAFY